MSRLSRLPDAVAGHWDTVDGRDMAERYLAMPREALGKAELSDMALANAQYLEDISVGSVTLQSAIAMQTAAKERIRWLSAHLAAALSREDADGRARSMFELCVRNGHSAEETLELVGEVLGIEGRGI